jgi:hypothetical protein
LLAAQARQHFAERRLLRVQDFGRARQALFAKQQIDYAKRVQVEIPGFAALKLDDISRLAGIYRPRVKALSNT